MSGGLVTVFRFEVVEPFLSLAAAPQHIPSWIRLPLRQSSWPKKGQTPRFLLRPSRTAGSPQSS